MKLAMVMGCRPEIIKMSPVIKECELRGLDYFILHTGQHYSYNMDGVFFEQLKLPRPKYNLGVGSGSYAEQVSRALLGIEKVLLEEKPSVALVYGDTNSCIAGALAASRLGVPVGHVEAGLRSYFSGMPEEINRVLADHCSDYLFVPTENSRSILIGEGISDDKVFVTGNTIVDVVYEYATEKQAERDSDGLLRRIKSIWEVVPRIEYSEYILATVHRQENVDNYERFSSILAGLEKVSCEFQLPIVYPIHPGARKMIEIFGLKVKGIDLIEPMDYLKFLWLEEHARLALTDSGGVQEECCILGTPCITLRDNTERPETIEVGANILAGVLPDKIVEYAKKMVGRDNCWSNPYGDGKAAQRIIKILGEKYGQNIGNRKPWFYRVEPC